MDVRVGHFSFFYFFRVVSRGEVRVHHFDLSVSRGLRPTVCCVGLVSRRFLLRHDVGLHQVPYYLVGVLDGLVFGVFLGFPGLFLVKGFFRFPCMDAFYGRYRVLRGVGVLVRVRHGARLISRAGVLVHHFRAVLYVGCIRGFLGFGGVGVSGSSSFLPSVPFLFLGFVRGREVRVLFLRVVRDRGDLVVRASISLQWVFRRCP